MTERHEHITTSETVRQRIAIEWLNAIVSKYKCINRVFQSASADRNKGRYFAHRLNMYKKSEEDIS